MSPEKVRWFYGMAAKRNRKEKARDELALMRSVRFAVVACISKEGGNAYTAAHKSLVEELRGSPDEGEQSEQQKALGVVAMVARQAGALQT